MKKYLTSYILNIQSVWWTKKSTRTVSQISKDTRSPTQIFISLELSPLILFRHWLSSFMHILGSYTETVYNFISIHGPVQHSKGVWPPWNGSDPPRKKRKDNYYKNLKNNTKKYIYTDLCKWRPVTFVKTDRN